MKNALRSLRSSALSPVSIVIVMSVGTATVNAVPTRCPRRAGVPSDCDLLPLVPSTPHGARGAPGCRAIAIYCRSCPRRPASGIRHPAPGTRTSRLSNTDVRSVAAPRDELDGVAALPVGVDLVIELLLHDGPGRSRGRALTRSIRRVAT